MKLKRLKASTALMTRQTDAEQRRPTIKKLEVKQVEFKLGEDCWDIQDKRMTLLVDLQESVIEANYIQVLGQVLNEAYQILNDPVKKDVKACKVNKSSAGEASTATAAPKCCLSNVLVLKEVSHYCLGARMICAASVYFMLLMQDLMLPVVISYVNVAIDTTAIGFKRRS
ncbi:hypothetical protein Tco_0969926 [Tanacetum coccineum]